MPIKTLRVLGESPILKLPILRNNQFAQYNARQIFPLYGTFFHYRDKSKSCELEFTVSIRQNFSQQSCAHKTLLLPYEIPTYMKQQANYLTCFYHFTKCSHEFQTHKMLTYLNEQSLYPFNNVCINLRTHSELHTQTTSLYYTSHQALNNKS